MPKYSMRLLNTPITVHIEPITKKEIPINNQSLKYVDSKEWRHAFYQST